MWLELAVGLLVAYFLIRDAVCGGMLRAWKLKERQDAKAAKSAPAASPATLGSPRPAAPPAVGSHRKA
jgi:hypothetical protein